MFINSNQLVRIRAKFELINPKSIIVLPKFLQRFWQELALTDEISPHKIYSLEVLLS